MRILVAENDTFFRDMMRETLEEAGYQVVVATTGKEALEKAVAEPLDLIILDVVLPKLLGTEVSQVLRRYSSTSPIPILLVGSGIAEIEAAGGGPAEFLADDFIHKPFRPGKLLERIQRLLSAPSRFAEQGRQGPPTPAPGRERRKHPRLPIDVEVSARTAEVLMCHPMINLSSGGVYLESETQLSRNDAVELRFAIPEVAGLLAAEGTVTWCLKVRRKKRWALGIRFTSIRPEDLDRIRRYTTTLMQVVRPSGVPQD